MTLRIGRLMTGAAVAVAMGAVAVSQSDVRALTASATLNVSASVAAKCTIAAPTDLDFGAYDPVGLNATADLDSSTNLSVACTKGSPNVWIGFDGGRVLSNGSDSLTYELYTTGARTSVWGNTLATGVSYTAASKAAVNIPVFGRIAGGQDVSVGTYLDTVTATINF